MRSPNFAADSSLVLKVVAGPQRGACIALPPANGRLRIAGMADPACDVMLRDESTRAHRLRVQVLSHGLRVELLAGTIRIAGRQRVAPCAEDLFWFQALEIGQTVLVAGSAKNETAWQQAHHIRCRRISDAGSSSAAGGAHPSDRSPCGTWLSGRGKGSQSRTSSITRRSAFDAARRPLWRGALWGSGLTGLVLLILTVAAGQRPASAGPVQQQSALRAILRQPAFERMRAERGADGRWRLQGDLLHWRDRAQLDRLLADATLPALVQARIGEQLAADVEEVYRLNGIAAEARPANKLEDVGRIEVHTRERSTERLRQVEAVARRDLAGLQALHVLNKPPVSSEAPPDPLSDAGKQLAAIVPGPSAYLVTADGTRYFPGALMPSGHRLTAIDGGQITLERNGHEHPLTF